MYIPNAESSIKAKFQKVNPKVNILGFYQNYCIILLSTLLHQSSNYLHKIMVHLQCTISYFTNYLCKQMKI